MQRIDRDCYICCVAMATSKTYEEVSWFLTEFEWEVIEKRGTYGDTLDRLWKAVGYTKGEDFVSIFVSEYELHSTSQLMPKMLWGRRALLQVKSLNFEGESHMVYWDGHTLHDPSNKRQYSSLAQVFDKNWEGWITLLNNDATW